MSSNNFIKKYIRENIQKRTVKIVNDFGGF